MKSCRFIEDDIYFCGNFMINKVTVFLCTVCRTLIKYFKIYKCDEKSFFTVFLALCCTMGFAQLSFNVKAGLNLSSYIGDNSDHSKFKPGARVGVGMEYQSSLFFSQKGAKYSEGYDGSIIDADADVKINQLYLELPINVQFRFNIADNTNLVIATGPYLACGVGGKTKVDGGASVGSINITGDDKIDTFGNDGLDYNRFDAGWNIGLGVEFGRILVGLDTQLGFCKVMDGNAPHNANIGITLGYKF